MDITTFNLLFKLQIYSSYLNLEAKYREVSLQIFSFKDQFRVLVVVVVEFARPKFFCMASHWSIAE
jgi:hypothetical protein